MHPNRARWLGVAVSVLLAWFAVRAQSSAVEHASGHVLVKFKPELRRELSRGRNAAFPKFLARLNLPAGATLEEPPITDLIGDADNRFHILRLPPGLSVEKCLHLLERHADLEFAEADGIGIGALTTPNDPNFLYQWHHRNSLKLSASVRTPNAWDITLGSSNVIVAVLDTGVNTNVTEFAGRTLRGYNFVSGNANATDDHGHGTAVAGVVCASGNNGSQVAGVDWNCRLLPVKVLDNKNSGQYSWWAQGIDYAVNRGAKVINLSAGGSTTSTVLQQSIRNAIARGVIFVTVTHNHGKAAITFPGNMPESITVGSTDRLDQRSAFSNYGPMIDLVAPGTNIVTVGSSGVVEHWTGTSFAAPIVAGVCALLASVEPNLNQQLAKYLLCSGAEDDVGGATDTTGFDNYYGWGRLNAHNSLLLARTRIDSVTYTNNSVVVSWPSTSNAIKREPYVVEYRHLNSADWQVAQGRFGYAADRAWFTNASPATQGCFYRVRFRQAL